MMKLRCRSCKSTFEVAEAAGQTDVPCPECGQGVPVSPAKSRARGSAGKSTRAARSKPGHGESSGRRRKTAAKQTAKRRRRRPPEDQDVGDLSHSPDEYDTFMQSYGTSTEVDLPPATDASQDPAGSKRGRRKVGDVSRPALGLLIQGCALSASTVLLGLLLVLWTFGYLETGSLKLGWIVLVAGIVAMLVGEALCLTIPDDSGARRIGIGAAACAGLLAIGLATDYFITNKSAGAALVFDLLNLILIIVRLGLVAMFLSRVAAYIQEPTYETRSVFAMVGMPLAAAATFAYMRFAPVVPAEAEVTEKWIMTGLQWWIVMTSVAVVVMYLSILVGMGLAMRRR